LILVSAERAKDFPQKPVYLLGIGESVETPMVSQMEDFTSSRAFRVAGAKAFAEAGITHDDVDHLMIYDAFAHLPIYGLEDLGFVPRGEAGRQAPAQVEGAKISVCHGVGGMFAASGTIIMSNKPP
jgi:acetyl-CoA acetyltransferase